VQRVNGNKVLDQLQLGHIAVAAARYPLRMLLPEGRARQPRNSSLGLNEALVFLWREFGRTLRRKRKERIVCRVISQFWGTRWGLTPTR